MAYLTLVLGGVRSGKSSIAEQLAGQSPPVTYVATAQAGDAEMTRRIASHRQRRVPGWSTLEEPWDLAGAVAGLLASAPGRSGGCVLIECLTLWLTNLMLGVAGKPGRDDGEILAEVTSLIGALPKGTGRVVLVTQEAGCGIIPANPMARRFGDLLGEANQRLAAAATEVYVCVAGIPLRIK